MILKSVTMRMMGVAVTPESEIEPFLNYNIKGSENGITNH
jgi:hypothetical protein